MAVFTSVSDAQARDLLTRYNLGTLQTLTGISAGIENTNYFLTTDQGQYVLTLFEVLTAEQLPFYIELMHHLADRGLPVPQPQTMHDGSRLTSIQGKPCAIVSRLPGRHTPEPNVAQCALTAEVQARMHLAARDFPMRQPNLRGPQWWFATAPKLRGFLDADQLALMDMTLAEQQQFSDSGERDALPSGPAHCDLFRDNVLFDGTAQAPVFGGVIDFYFAGDDAWLFDVAVSINDWCVERATGVLMTGHCQAWLSAYAAVRPFSDAERRAWPGVLRAAALRFWLSRLFDYHRPRPAEDLTPHDPRVFERILRERTTGPIPALP